MIQRVLITPMTLQGVPGRYYDLLQSAGLEIVQSPFDHQLSEEETLQALNNIQAVVAGMEPYTQKVFQKHPQLKVIARVGVGFDSVDVKSAIESGVAVAITPGANHETVAEHAFSLLLALTKRVTIGDAGIRIGQWRRGITVPVRNRLLGIVGLGRIGKAMVPRAEAFGMKVIAHETQPDHEFVKQHGIELVDLDNLFKRSDFISLHAPATAETKKMVNAARLKLMKPTAFLINTARGVLVDEPALAEAVRSGKIAGAGLDVFDVEPMPQTHPFFDLPNIIMTPHNGGTDEQSIQDMAYLAAKAIVEIKAGRWPRELLVNPQIQR